MKCPGVFATTLMLTACVSSQPPRPDTGVVAAQDPHAYAQEALAAAPVQVDIAPQLNVDTVECRRAAPTGTRITTQRCESSGGTDQTARDQMLRDIEAIRRQHWQLEAARQNAFREAMNQGPAPAPSPQP